MTRPYLTAIWRDLVLVTFAVPDELAVPLVPPGCDADRWDGRCHMSLVALQMDRVRVRGLPIPGLTTYPQVNLRLYVRHDGRAAVRFVQELVPSRLLAAGARWLYGEPFRAGRIRASLSQAHEGPRAEYRVRSRSSPLARDRAGSRPHRAAGGRVVRALGEGARCAAAVPTAPAGCAPSTSRTRRGPCGLSPPGFRVEFAGLYGPAVGAARRDLAGVGDLCRRLGGNGLRSHMNLLVVRHAIAMDPAEYAREHPDDAGRPLTPEGQKKMKRAARGLHVPRPGDRAPRHEPVDARPRDGRDPRRRLQAITPVVVPVLAPGQPAADVGRWLEGARRHDTVAIVGHEPGLSRTVSWLLAGAERSLLELKKGAACLLSIPDAVGAGCATLLLGAGARPAARTGAIAHARRCPLELLARPAAQSVRLDRAGPSRAAAAKPRERVDDPKDAEALHDFRVALRRLRTTLRAYRAELRDSVAASVSRASATSRKRPTALGMPRWRSPGCSR